jgi:hypothetical protein
MASVRRPRVIRTPGASQDAPARLALSRSALSLASVRQRVGTASRCRPVRGRAHQRTRLLTSSAPRVVARTDSRNGRVVGPQAQRKRTVNPLSAGERTGERPGPPRGGKVNLHYRHRDYGPQARLNRSSQHLEWEVLDGSSAWLGCGGDGSAGNAVSGAASGGQGWASAVVLVSDRTGGDEYRCGRRGRRVAGRRDAVVPGMWRGDAAIGLCPGIG